MFCRRVEFAYWTSQKQVRVEIVDIRPVRFEHAEFKVVVRSTLANRVLDICRACRATTWACCSSHRAVTLDTLQPGERAFWKGPADARVVEVDLRETIVDVGGQEIMTADKVTLRLNAVVTYKVVNARKAVSQTDDVRQARYRDTQLVLRAAVGARELDVVLTDKDAVGREIQENVGRCAGRARSRDRLGRHSRRDSAG